MTRLAAVLPQSPRTPPSEDSSTNGMTTALGAGKDSSEAGTVPRVVFRDSSPRASLRCPPRLNQAAPYAQSFPAWRTGQTGGL